MYAFYLFSLLDILKVAKYIILIYSCRASIAQSVERLPGLTLFRAPPMPAGRYVEENSSAAILATNRSEGVAPEVNLRDV